MSETLTSPAPPKHEQEVSANFLRGEAAQLLGALVVKLLTDEHFQKAAAELMANHSATKESQKTEKTNRQLWNDLMDSFQGSSLPPLYIEDPYNKPVGGGDVLYGPSAFLPKDYWSDGSTRFTYDEQGNRTEHESGTQWDGKYGWGPNGKPKSGPEAGAGAAEDKDDATPNASTPSGPRMPFSVHPASMKPDQTQTAAASRANDLLREGLQKQGWEGGVPTEDQLKKATRETLRNLHTDRNSDLSDVDQEAAKLISGQMSEIKQELYSNQPEASQDDNQAQAA